MRILVDICHLAQANFFKNAVDILNKKDIDIYVTARARGKLVDILMKEYAIDKIVTIGKHHGTAIGKIFGTVKRDFQLLAYFHEKEFDVGTGVANYYMGHVSYLHGKPSVLFSDDYEYNLTFTLAKLTATYLVVPHCMPTNGRNILRYNGFKELAHLHPNYFTPNKKALGQYEVTPANYVFVRAVSNTSLNYRRLQRGGLHDIIKYLRDMGYEILLSLEDKSLVNNFRDNCIILEEPVNDIHSLMSFAALTISSGDSMARESCLVGTPAIYTGERDMAINNELIKRGCLFKVGVKEQLSDAVKNIIGNDIKKETERKIKKAIKEEWVDTTEVIADTLLGVVNKDDTLIEKYKVS